MDAKDYPQRDKHSPFIQAILSKEKGEVDWYDIEGGNGAGNSYYKETTSHYAETAPVKRTCTTLNILFEENKITNDFDFIKIDVQGAELDILAGASKLLDNAQVILLEVPFVGEVNKNAPRFLDYISFMDKIGFTCYDLVEIHRHYGMLLQVDIMFIKKNHPILERMQNTIHQFGKI
jgi:FkbM family methyltransferase